MYQLRQVINTNEQQNMFSYDITWINIFFKKCFTFTLCFHMLQWILEK